MYCIFCGKDIFHCFYSMEYAGAWLEGYICDTCIDRAREDCAWDDHETDEEAEADLQQIFRSWEDRDRRSLQRPSK